MAHVTGIKGAKDQYMSQSDIVAQLRKVHEVHGSYISKTAADLIESQAAEIAELTEATQVDALKSELVASQAMLAAMRAALEKIMRIAQSIFDLYPATSEMIQDIAKAALSPRAHTEDKT